MLCLKQEHTSEKVMEEKKQLRKREMVGKLANYFTSTIATAALNVVAQKPKVIDLEHEQIKQKRLEKKK